MKKILAMAFALMIVMALQAAAQPFHYYTLDIEYRFGNVSIGSVTVEPSQTELKAPLGQYIAEVVSFDNHILNVTFFDIPLLVLYDTVDPETGEINGGGQVELNETDVTLYAPYFENAAEINVYDWNLTKLASVDVREYAQATAEQGSDEAQQPVAEPEAGTPEEADQQKEEAKGKVFQKAFVIILGVLLFLAFIIWLWRTRRGR